ncbi:hypothetical protein AK812_SmicGene15822 [Symbiodinium microadriaticum]|uniref:Uncharacterized protein n=1 Tax=Symbiodinium microadriaticum TaxID=2951 RepID=A0A1Q9E1Y0_SYMMI|nr:hypothetical protein AK812_SmicGene15822 [Symbiodinium microadriaticum]
MLAPFLLLHYSNDLIVLVFLVLKGYEVVKAVESLGATGGEPEENAVIVDCGTLDFEEGEQEKLKYRRTQGGVDLTVRNEMLERVRGATRQGL